MIQFSGLFLLLCCNKCSTLGKLNCQMYLQKFGTKYWWKKCHCWLHQNINVCNVMDSCTVSELLNWWRELVLLHKMRQHFSVRERQTVREIAAWLIGREASHALIDQSVCFTADGDSAWVSVCVCVTSSWHHANSLLCETHTCTHRRMYL